MENGYAVRFYIELSSFAWIALFSAGLVGFHPRSVFSEPEQRLEISQEVGEFRPFTIYDVTEDTTCKVAETNTVSNLFCMQLSKIVVRCDGAVF